MGIHKGAEIGKDCVIAESAIIHSNVVLGSNCEVGDFAILGHPTHNEEYQTALEIGDGAVIRSHTTIYQGSKFGSGLTVGHGSMLREGLLVGENFQAGSMNDLEGDAQVGDFVRFHSNVHMSRGTKLGSFIWIFPYVVTTNDPIPPSGLKEGVTIADGCVVATSSVVLPGSKLAEGAFIGAMTRAQGDIPAGALYVGNPGKVVGSIRKLRHEETGKQHPWMNHFCWAYPEKVQSRLEELHRRIEDGCDKIERENNR